MPKDDLQPTRHHCAANDNGPAAGEPAAVDAALTRIAEAVGRHIAREHIRARDAANDNDARER